MRKSALQSKVRHLDLTPKYDCCIDLLAFYRNLLQNEVEWKMKTKSVNNNKLGLLLDLLVYIFLEKCISNLWFYKYNGYVVGSSEKSQWSIYLLLEYSRGLTFERIVFPVIY